MVDTLPTDPAPDGYTVKATIGLWEAEFGDGYSQRSAKGINNVKHGVPLKWTNLSGDEKDILKDFFVAHSDGSAWYYVVYALS